MDCKTILKKEQLKKLLYCCGMDVFLVFVIVVLAVDLQYRGGMFLLLLLMLWVLPLVFLLKETLYFPVLWKLYLQKETEQRFYTLISERRLPVVAVDAAGGYAAYCEAVYQRDDIDLRAKTEAAALGGFVAGWLDTRQPRERQYYQRALDAALATYLRERQ